MGAYSKAITAFLGSLIVGYYQARTADSVAGSGITIDEWLDMIAMALAVTLGVYGVPNTPTPPRLPAITQARGIAPVIPHAILSKHDEGSRNTGTPGEAPGATR